MTRSTRDARALTISDPASTMVATNTITTATSVGYQRLLAVLELALKKARNALDVEQAVQQCYGDEDNEVFCTLLEGILDKLHSTVTTDMMSFFREKQVEEKLLKLEAVIAKLDRDAAIKKQKAANDKASTVSTLQRAKLPTHITSEDLVQHQTYQRILQENAAIRNEIAALEEETAELQAVRDCHQEIADTFLGEAQAAKASLEQAANLCSTVS